MLLRVVLVLLVVALIVWLLSTRWRSRAGKSSRPLSQPEAFARCAHCGVHLPVNDAVLDGGVAYCSEAHRLAGPSDRGAP